MLVIVIAVIFLVFYFPAYEIAVLDMFVWMLIWTPKFNPAFEDNHEVIASISRTKSCIPSLFTLPLSAIVTRPYLEAVEKKEPNWYPKFGSMAKTFDWLISYPRTISRRVSSGSYSSLSTEYIYVHNIAWILSVATYRMQLAFFRQIGFFPKNRFDALIVGIFSLTDQVWLDSQNIDVVPTPKG